MLKGQVPPAARPFVYGARLVAPAKDDGGHRPLGGGFIMRRVAFGFAAKCVAAPWAEKMAPEQLGPTRDGCLRFAATVRACLEAHPDWVLIKLDFRNAFNECDRAAFLSYIAEHMPCLLPALHAAYGEPVYISALGADGAVRFLSRWGSTQGCNFGPHCFQAALQKALRSVAAEFSDCFVGGVHDDIGIAGPPARARAAMDALLAAASGVSLTPSGHKFGLLVSSSTQPAETRELEAAIAAHTPPEALAAGKRCFARCDGLVIAGVPVGSVPFQVSFAQSKLDTHSMAHSQLQCLGDAQSMLLLLRYCLSVRLGYLLRALSPAVMEPVAAASDAMHHVSLAALLDRELSSLHSSVLVQAALPPREGGVGVVSAVRVSSAAFLAAALSSIRFIQASYSHLVPVARLSSSSNERLPFVVDAVRALSLHQQLALLPPTIDLDALVSASPKSTSQHVFAERVHLQVRNELLEGLPECCNAQHRARLVSCGGPHAGAWLGAIPVCRHSTARDPVYRRALHVRLGVPLRELATGLVRCSCGETVDPYGYHYGSGCKKGNRGNAWGARHEVFNDALISALLGLGARGAHAVTQNYLGEAALTGRGRGYVRPDGRLRGYHAVDRHVYWDSAIADPAGRVALRDGSAAVAGLGAAARRRCAVKNAKYATLVSGAGSQFVAAVAERFGSVSGPLQGLYKQVAGEGERDPLRDEGWTFSSSSRITFMAQRVGFALAMGDALMVEALCARDLRGPPPSAARPRGRNVFVGTGYDFDECSASWDVP